MLTPLRCYGVLLQRSSVVGVHITYYVIYFVPLRCGVYLFYIWCYLYGYDTRAFCLHSTRCFARPRTTLPIPCVYVYRFYRVTLYHALVLISSYAAEATTFTHFAHTLRVFVDARHTMVFVTQFHSGVRNSGGNDDIVVIILFVVLFSKYIIIRFALLTILPISLFYFIPIHTDSLKIYYIHYY